MVCMPRGGQAVRHVTPAPGVRAGAHGFNGGKSGTVLLVPGPHDIKIDYAQVPAAFLVCAQLPRGQQ